MLAEMIWNQATVGTLMSLSIPIIAIVAVMWSHVERTRSTNELKRTMVERGMSVDEIERVLAIHARK
jgi:hypothetical protein